VSDALAARVQGGSDLEKGHRHLAVRKPTALLDLEDSAKRNRSKRVWTRASTNELLRKLRCRARPRHPSRRGRRPPLVPKPRKFSNFLGSDNDQFAISNLLGMGHGAVIAVEIRTGVLCGERTLLSSQARGNIPKVTLWGRRSYESATKVDISHGASKTTADRLHRREYHIVVLGAGMCSPPSSGIAGLMFGQGEWAKAA
jgi:hypothetical protein